MGVSLHVDGSCDWQLICGARSSSTHTARTEVAAAAYVACGGEDEARRVGRLLALTCIVCTSLPSAQVC